MDFKHFINVLFLLCMFNLQMMHMQRLENVNVIPMFQYFVKNYANFFQYPSEATKDQNVIYKEYDFIVIGAGSGGSVVANRLTEIPEWSVLLLEAGKEEIFLTDVPILVTYMIATDYNWGYKTEKQEGVCLGLKGKRCNWHRGKAMGGTSVINYMIYTRGFKSDYDGWARMGNYGWSYDEILPYFLKSEDIRVADLFDSKYHSQGGYLKVERPEWRSPVAPVFMNACQELGYNMTDPNGASPVGCSYVLANTVRGTRCSASKAFLRPVRSRKNLNVSKESRVTKILIDPKSKTVYGVEFVKKGRRFSVRAKKEVILSAGALNSPQLLMLSGVGPQQHLKDLGIPVIQNLKVGYNLQDHVSLGGLTFLVNDTVTIVENRYMNIRYVLDYFLRGSGPYTLPGGTEALLFMSTKQNEEDEKMSPDIEMTFAPGALTGDSGGSLRNMLNVDNEIYETVYKPYAGRDAFALTPVLLKPKSKGYLKLRSKDPFESPLFYSNYFQDERDLQTLLEGIKEVIRLSKTKSFQKFSSTLLSTPFPGCRHVPFGSDQYWMCAARHFPNNLQHQVGTCKMGPDSDPDAVVDPELRVRGISRLRIVDASIMPVIPAGHTNAVVFMIGEKAADMIKNTWWHKLNSSSLSSR